MCQFPDLPDLVSDLSRNPDDVTYTELERFLPDATTDLYVIADPDDVDSVKIIRAQNAGFSKHLLGKVFTELNGTAVITTERLRVESTVIRLHSEGIRVPGVSLYYKPELFADNDGPIEIHLVLRKDWEDTWAAVEHDKYPDVDDVTRNAPMKLLGPNELRAICSNLIPLEHQAYVVARLARRYGWRRGIPAGNQVCLIG